MPMMVMTSSISTRVKAFWSAAGSEAPRRFWMLSERAKSGVAASLCHRSPKEQ
jgi:hypothetical protein